MTAIRSAIQPAIRAAISGVYGSSSAWSPLTLFAASEAGVWYDPSDFSTMFQDSAGTTPVTAVGDPVGLILDKSDGLVLGPDLVTNGDFSAGLTGWTGASYTASGGVVTQTGTSSLTQVAVVQSGTWYRVSIDVTEVTASGGCSFQLGGVNGAQFSVTTTGTVTQYLLATVTGSLSFVHRGGATFRGSLDNFSCKVLLGNHAYQATDASRPILGRTPATGQRNLLTYTERFDNAVWVLTEVTVTPNAAVAPDGTTTGDSVTPSTANLSHRLKITPVPAATGRTLSAYVKANGYSKVALKESVTSGVYASFDLSAVSVLASSAGTSPTISSIGSGWYRITLVMAAEISSGLQVSVLSPGYTTGDPNGSLFAGDGTSGIYLWGAQLETGSSATAYQKVTAAYDVTEAGVADCYNLYFDGVDDSLATAAIDFTGTDAVGVFAGIRKSSDAARGTIVELTASAAANNGSFHLAAPNAASATIAWESKGTVLADAVAASGVAAPLTAVLTGTSDISGDTAILRVNGAQADADVGDQGTGNFSNAAMYIGRRGGSSLPFKGSLHSLTVLGRTPTAGEIASAESYAAGKSGVTLP